MESHETLLSYELPAPFTEMVGLEARLLLGGEAINPTHNIGKVDKEKLGQEIPSNVAIRISTKSKELRQSYWKKQVKEGKVENNFKSQFDRWQRETVKIVTNKDNQDKREGLSHLTAIGINFDAFDSNQAQTLYDRYFKKDEEGKIGGFTRFKADVIASYTNEAGVIDYEKLKQDLPTVEWLSTIFGADEEKKEKFLAEIISQSIFTEARVKVEPDKLVDELNEKKDNKTRGDRLTTHEKELLLYLGNTPPPKAQPEPAIKPAKKPDIAPEPNIDVSRLTSQLAETDKDAYKDRLFVFLANKYPNVHSAWEKLEQAGMVSKDRLILDNTTWQCQSDSSDSITLGTQSLPQEVKKRLIFEDRYKDYPDVIAYKLSHELSHKLITHLVDSDETAKRGLENLNAALAQLRQTHPDKGIIILANLANYKDAGPDIQSKEEITELVNMYLLNPNYLKKYLNLLTQDQYHQLRSLYGLVRLDPKITEVIFEIVKTAIDPFLTEKKPV